MSIIKRAVTAAAAAVLAFAGTSCGKKAEEKQTYPDLTVTFLDAGKADAMILTTANSAVVIDCGKKGDGKDIVAYLEEKGVTTLDYLIITHYDQDHVGGASKVLKNFDVKNVLAPDYTEVSEEMDKYYSALNEKEIIPQKLTSDLSFTLDGAEYTVYAPQQTYYGEDNDNDFSLVTKVVYHDTSFLFTGDAMETRLGEIMDIGECTLLKVPYHGRKLDNLGQFLDAVKPKCAVVCTSDDEFSGKVKDALESRRITTYATCYNGRITAVSNGAQLTVSCEKGS
ncbi:MAG: MBL fold metallo-hydrolase [Ruminococcus sp.]|nr:MBL fold metallo-hydrolase [Ruminococcus sp.]